MPDKAYTVPSTVYRHITTSQQRLKRARAAKCEVPALEHPPLRSLSEVQAERERICGAFVASKGGACPLPLFHEGDCQIDEE